MNERGADTERKLGRMVVREYTARRLVTEAQGKPLLVLGVLWAAFLPIVLLCAPWRGGAPLGIVLTAAAIVVAVSLLIARFVPLRERLTVDVEAGEVQIERACLLPRRAQVMRMELTAVEGVRCRRRAWQDEAGAEAVRWRVELLGAGQTAWPVTEWPAEEPMQGLARLIAEVSGRPMR